MSEISTCRADFEGTAHGAYLNTGAEGLPLKSCRNALEAYLKVKGRGAEGRAELYGTDRECKKRLAQLLGVSFDEIAILANASDGINTLCNSIDWKPGTDEVLVNDLEFPSNVLPWLRLREQGVRVRILRHRGWHLDPDDFKGQLTPNTRLVCVSHVSYLNGFRFDIAEIGKLVHSVGAIFSVDATQSLGRISIPMEEVDYLIASTYKWLVTPHGGGVVCCRRSLMDTLSPPSVGWWSVSDIFTADRFSRYELKPSAARFELGMPNFLTIYALNDALKYLLKVSVSAIETQLLPVCDYLVEELGRLGVNLITPLEQERRAGLVSFNHEDCETIARQLADQNVSVWGGDGRIRVSVHLYNNLWDVQQFFRALKV